MSVKIAKLFKEKNPTKKEPNRVRYSFELWAGPTPALAKRVARSTNDGGNYTQEHNAREVLATCFPDFTIEDYTNNEALGSEQFKDNVL